MAKKPPCYEYCELRVGSVTGEMVIGGHRLVVALALVLALVECGELFTPPPPSTVLSDGTLVFGINDIGGIDTFLGIRYGVIPKRFALAQPAWGGAMSGKHVDANKPGASCWQDDRESFVNQTMSEDCLFINVWGDVHTVKKKPVLVWIHGGGYTTGSGTPVGADGVGIFNGISLALSQNVVVVTLNYRLGSFGFLVVDDKHETGGMNGIRDQILALRWVQDNIVKFGGDKNEVTIFGESAGGTSVCMLSIAPDASSLFKRAIVQSGPCIGPWGPHSTAFGVKQRSLIFNALKVNSLDELRLVDPRALMQVGWPLPSNGWYNDRIFLPHNTSWYFSSGKVHVDDLFIGANSFDGTSELYPLIPNTSTQFKLYLGTTYGAANAATIYSAYDPLDSFNGSVVAAFVQQNGDNAVVCPSLSIARMINRTATNTNVWVYYYAHRFDCVDLAGVLGLIPSTGFREWASHASELPLLFGNLQFKDPLKKAWKQCAPQLTPAHTAVSKQLQQMWGHAAHGRASSSLWRPFRSGAVTVIAVDSRHVDDDFKKQQCGVLPSRNPL